MELPAVKLKSPWGPDGAYRPTTFPLSAGQLTTSVSELTLYRDTSSSMMKNSVELNTFHEPFTDAYYFGPKRRSSRYGDREEKDFIADRDVIEAEILDKSSGSRAFVKELAFQGEPYVSDRILSVSHQLLITRHPAAVYASLIKLKPDFTEDEFGFAALWRVRERLENLGATPLIIDGDTFRSAPAEETVRACEEIAIDVDPEMLFWTDGRIREWANGEEKSQAVWHNTLESSHTIIKPDEARVDVDIRPEHYRWYLRALHIYETLTSEIGARRPINDKNTLPVS